MLKIFVACPYNPEPLPGYREVFRSLERERSYVKFIFSDERIASDMILKKITDDIDQAQLCLCDLTGWNPNVCLEFGVAIGMGKAVHILYREPAKKGMFSWSKAPQLHTYPLASGPADPAQLCVT